MSGSPEPIQRIGRFDGLPWHEHRDAYAAIVLEGGYHEAGDEGRRLVRAGDIVIHKAYCGHMNRFERGGAVIVNVALSRSEAEGLASGRCADPEMVAADLHADPAARANILHCAIAATPNSGLNDLPDQLAAALRAHGGLRLDAWAAECGVVERTLRRQFALAYGMSPSAYRARARARRAWQIIAGSQQSLADISYALGFADQAHLSRAIRQLSAMSPTAVRHRGRLVQD